MYSQDWIDEKMHFDRDDPYCVWRANATNGKCGNSKEECDRCMRLRYKDDDITTYCDIYDDCEDCPRYGDDCGGREDEDD